MIDQLALAFLVGSLYAKPLKTAADWIAFHWERRKRGTVVWLCHWPQGMVYRTFANHQRAVAYCQAHIGASYRSQVIE